MANKLKGNICKEEIPFLKIYVILELKPKTK